MYRINCQWIPFSTLYWIVLKFYADDFNIYFILLSPSSIWNQRKKLATLALDGTKYLGWPIRAKKSFGFALIPVLQNLDAPQLPFTTLVTELANLVSILISVFGFANYVSLYMVQVDKSSTGHEL